MVANRCLHGVGLPVGIEPGLVVIGHDFERAVAVALFFEAVRIQGQESLRAEHLPLNHVNQFVEVKRFALRLVPENKSNCSDVGQTSGLPVHGASGSVNLMAAKLRARGPVNRQTRGLPHTPT